MRILVISHMYPSARDPVYGVFVHKQVRALTERGCEARVISPVPLAPWPLTALKKKWRDYAAVPARDRVEGVPVYYPRYLEFPRSYFLKHSGYLMFLGIRKLAEEIYREFPFELIHAHVALPDGCAAVRLKKFFPVPVVITVHGQDFQSTIVRSESLKQKVFGVLRQADGIITVSSKLKNMVREQDFAGKIEVVHNGVDLPEKPDGSLQAGRPGEGEGPVRPGRAKIISVSNLKKTKGIDLNIRALAALANRFPNIQYDIIGDGEERPSLERLAAELGLSGRVFFRGKLPHAEVLRQMASADIFCLPSWQEGFGAVYIEAMSQGIPAIGVQGEGISDVIVSGQNGLLVRPLCVEDITQALASLLGDPAYARTLGENGRRTVQDGLTWADNARKTAELYQRLRIRREQG